jgi:hypothetical protein
MVYWIECLTVSKGTYIWWVQQTDCVTSICHLVGRDQDQDGICITEDTS